MKRFSYLLFIIFAISYVFIVEAYFIKHLAIASGVLLIITGVWGIILNVTLIKLPIFAWQKYSKHINLGMIVIGVLVVLLKIFLGV